MEKLDRNFQCEISNLIYWTECFCVDLILLFFSPPLLQQKLTSNDIILWQINLKTIDMQNQHNLHPHDKAYYMFICLIHIKIVTREKKNRDTWGSFCDSPFILSNSDVTSLIQGRLFPFKFKHLFAISATKITSSFW